MLFSIIIPTFNSENTIRACLSSITSQSFPDWEILIMDGCSNDNTVLIANEFKSKRIHIFSEADNGIYDAMNKGIAKSQGEWLYFIGSDDYLLSKEVLSSVAKEISFDKDVIYGNVKSNGLRQESIGEWNTDNLIFNRCHQAIFYRRNIFDIFGTYNCKYKSCADFDLNLKWYLRKPEKSKYVDIDIAFFNSSGYSTQNNDYLFHNDFPWLCITRGWKKLTFEQKIKYARMSKNIKQKNIKQIMCFYLWAALRLLQVINEII